MISFLTVSERPEHLAQRNDVFHLAAGGPRDSQSQTESESEGGSQQI